MDKILLAVGHIELEGYIKETLKDEFVFVGESVHRENIINLIKDTSPDILVIRETLPGKTNIMNLVYMVRSNFQNIRIVFLAGERRVGDKFLANLVNYGIYDILHSGNLQVGDIINLIENPNTYQDIKHLQPVPDMEEDFSELEFIMPDEKESNDVEDKENIEFVMPDKERSVKDLDEERRRKIQENKREEIEESFIEKEEEYAYKDEESESLERAKIKIPEIKIPKIIIPRIKNPFEFEKRKKNNKKKETISKSQSKNEKIITFWGASSGVGTTTIAHSMAISLASDGNKVIYVELDEKKPSVAYWYDLGFVDTGIETSLRHLDFKEYKEIDKSIIKTRDLKKENNRDYKMFPDSLDFLFFSKQHLSGIETRPYKSSLKDLYMHLFYQLDYDYVILDVANDMSRKDLKDILMFSNMIFIVLTQDISNLGYHSLELNNLKKEGINIGNKSHYIVNKYIDLEFNTQKIRKWLEVSKITSIPNNREVYIEAGIQKRPVVLDKQGGISLRNKINELKSII